MGEKVEFTQVRYGFEFETLADVHNALTSTLQRLDDEFHNSTCTTTTHYLQDINSNNYSPGLRTAKQRIYEGMFQPNIDPEHKDIPQSRVRNEYVQRVFRFHLRDTLNALYKDRNLRFKANEMYGDPGCPNNPNAYAITHDSSVKMLQADSRCVLFYKDLYNGSFSLNLHEEYLKKASVVEHIEIVSPPLDLKNVENDVTNAFAAFTADGQIDYFNNSTTSNHIHFSLGEQGEILKNPVKLLHVCSFWLYFEPLFMFLVPEWRRNNEYCLTMFQRITDKIGLRENKAKQLLFNFKAVEKHIRKEPSNEDAIAMIIGLFQGDPTCEKTRFACFNMINMLPGKIGTVEISLKHGSTSANELAWFVKLFGRFLQRVDEINQDAHEYFTSTTPTIAFFRSTVWNAINKYHDTTLGWEDCYPDIEQLIPLFDSVIGNKDLMDFVRTQFLLVNGKLGFSMPIRIEPPQPMQIGSAGKGLTRVFVYDAVLHKKLKNISRNIQYTPGFLKHHTLAFRGMDQEWEGAVVSIVPKKGGPINVRGGVASLTHEQHRSLDKAMQAQGYACVKRKVFLDTPESHLMAHIYVKKDIRLRQPPSPRYVRALRAFHRKVSATSPTHH